MIQTQLYTKKLNATESLSIKDLEAADTDHTYSFHTIIFLGNYSDLTTITLNGVELKLPGAFVYNQTPISSVVVDSSTDGIYVIGKKTKKFLFN